MIVWVVYDHPRDFPDLYIVRRQTAQQDGTIANDVKAFGFQELERARAWLELQGLTRLERHPDDDPVILETWI